MLFYAAFAAVGVAALACEDRRLEPVFACAFFHFARLSFLPVDENEFLCGVAALFALCALLDRDNWLFHAVSGLFVLLAASVAATIP